MALMVKIRYMGESTLKGRPKRESIKVGGHRFWNVRKFKEQNDDLSYNRPLEFYEANKEVLDNRKLFLVEMVSEKGKVIKEAAPMPDIPASEEVSVELVDRGVTIKDGKFGCPKCKFTTPATAGANARMIVHMMEH